MSRSGPLAGNCVSGRMKLAVYFPACSFSMSGTAEWQLACRFEMERSAERVSPWAVFASRLPARPAHLGALLLHPPPSVHTPGPGHYDVVWASQEAQAHRRPLSSGDLSRSTAWPPKAHSSPRLYRKSSTPTRLALSSNAARPLSSSPGHGSLPSSASLPALTSTTDRVGHGRETSEREQAAIALRHGVLHASHSLALQALVRRKAEDLELLRRNEAHKLAGSHAKRRMMHARRRAEVAQSIHQSRVKISTQLMDMQRALPPKQSKGFDLAVHCSFLIEADASDAVLETSEALRTESAAAAALDEQVQ